MSPRGCQQMSAKPCNRNAEESFPVLSFKSREQKPPNLLLIQDENVLQPSTTVVERILSWFQSSHQGRNHGAQARVWPIPHRRGPGDRANLGLMADRSGTPDPATLSPQRCPSSGVGLSAGLIEPRRAEKWVADCRSGWGCDPVWHAACAGAGPVGCRGGLQGLTHLCDGIAG